MNSIKFDRDVAYIVALREFIIISRRGTKENELN